VTVSSLYPHSLLIYVGTVEIITNNEKVHVPWGEITANTDRYIDPNDLPINVQIGEISKMKAQALRQCLDMWIASQERGEVPFKFKTALPGDMRTRIDKRKRQDDKLEDNKRAKADHVLKNAKVEPAPTHPTDDEDEAATM
jgi:hypothetical protein